MKTNPPHHRRGFTMIELLVVIVVIGILAAILMPALSGAVRRARIGVVAMEISQLESAVETYKTQNAGDYPPDCTNLNAIQNHLRRAYPRSNLSINSTNWSPTSGYQAYNVNKQQLAYLGKLDPSEALVFWLTMLVNNPIDPLESSSATTSWKTPLYTFDQARLLDNDHDGFYEYYPKFGETAPYVYFTNASYGSTAGPLTVGPLNSGLAAAPPTVPQFTGSTVKALGVARPYLFADGITAATDGTTPVASWMNPTKFQIISAGLDGDYGLDVTGKPSKVFPNYQFPSGKNVLVDSNGNPSADRDNITNFSEGKTLQDNLK